MFVGLYENSPARVPDFFYHNKFFQVKWVREGLCWSRVPCFLKITGTFEANEMQRPTTAFDPVPYDFLHSHSNITQKSPPKICTYDENNNSRQNLLAFIVEKLYDRCIRTGNVSRK